MRELAFVIFHIFGFSASRAHRARRLDSQEILFFVAAAVFVVLVALALYGQRHPVTLDVRLLRP